MLPNRITAVTLPVRAWRLAVVAGLLLAEILLLTLSFDSACTATASHLPYWFSQIASNSGAMLRIAIAVLGTLALTIAPRATETINRLTDTPARHSASWLAIHVLVIAGFYWQTRFIFPDACGMTGPLNFLVPFIWMASGLLVVVSAALLVAPGQVWRATMISERRALACSLAAGLLAWCAGLAAQHFWQPLAKWTLFLAHRLLSYFYTEVEYDPSLGTVGTSKIIVEVAPECSGYEGIALVTVFTAVYLWLFRERIDFRRALWLFPAGIVCIWCANVVRIAALVAVGTSISPELAVQGFHSQAGWLAFTAIALGIIWVSHRLGWVVKATPVDFGGETAQGSKQLATPLLVPMLVLLATAMISDAFSAGFAMLYPLSVFATIAALVHFRSSYRSHAFELSWVPVAIGIAVFALWMILTPGNPETSATLVDHLSSLPPAIAIAWIAVRVLGSVVVVPIAEELAFRGYLLRKLVSKDFEQVPYTRFTWMSFAVSSALFGYLHSSWVAGTVAGALFAFAMYHRGRLSDAIIAHATANALIAVAVLGFDRWDLW